MSFTNEKLIIISIGGSLIVPDTIDTHFLKKLNTFIRDYTQKGRKFFLVTGGGRTARYYQWAAKQVIGTMTEEDIDWLGVHTTRLNGHLLRTIFHDIAHPRIIENYEHRLENWHEPVVIGAGWKPGWSTDYCAVTLAKDYGAHLMINLSNIDWIYDKDPKKYPDAQPLRQLTWSRCSEIVGDTWKPGLNAPFDPIATQLAKTLDLTAIIANGNDFENITHIIEGTKFKGTVIHPDNVVEHGIMNTASL